MDIEIIEVVTDTDLLENNDIIDLTTNDEEVSNVCLIILNIKFVFFLTIYIILG